MSPRLDLRRAVMGAATEIGRTIGRMLLDAPRCYGRALRLPLKLADAITLREPPNAAGPARSEDGTGAAQGGQPPSRLLLEAETGRQASGIFLVENTRRECVSGQFSMSGFADGTGRPANPPIMFSPSEIRLEPGEHVLVHVVALVDQALEPDVRYLAEISIPGLSDTRVPIAVCRRVERAALARDNRRMPRPPAEDAHDPVAGLKALPNEPSPSTARRLANDKGS